MWFKFATADTKLRQNQSWTIYPSCPASALVRNCRCGLNKNEACDEAAHRTYNQASCSILDDTAGNNVDFVLLEAFGHDMTKASCNQIIANKGIHINLTNGFDSNTRLDNNDSDKEKLKFILPKIFQLHTSERRKLTATTTTILW